MRDSRYGMWDARYWFLDAGYGMADAGYILTLIPVLCSGMQILSVTLKYPYGISGSNV